MPKVPCWQAVLRAEHATRLSFESAMLRLGGKSISSADPATSSRAKGESLADTVRVASNYADVLVIRHPRDGAAKLAATYASVPVINGGDGAHEHPTQTLCDLFTLVQEGKNLKHLNVAIQGRSQRQPHDPLVRLCARSLQRQYHADAGQGDGAAASRRLASQERVQLPHAAAYAQREG
jgi:ornithine carbamoyltransferase